MSLVHMSEELQLAHVPGAGSSAGCPDERAPVGGAQRHLRNQEDPLGGRYHMHDQVPEERGCLLPTGPKGDLRQPLAELSLNLSAAPTIAAEKEQRQALVDRCGPSICIGADRTQHERQHLAGRRGPNDTINPPGDPATEGTATAAPATPSSQEEEENAPPGSQQPLLGQNILPWPLPPILEDATPPRRAHLNETRPNFAERAERQRRLRRDRLRLLPQMVPPLPPPPSPAFEAEISLSGPTASHLFARPDVEPILSDDDGELVWSESRDVDQTLGIGEEETSIWSGLSCMPVENESLATGTSSLGLSSGLFCGLENCSANEFHSEGRSSSSRRSEEGRIGPMAEEQQPCPSCRFVPPKDGVPGVSERCSSCCARTSGKESSPGPRRGAWASSDKKQTSKIYQTAQSLLCWAPYPGSNTADAPASSPSRSGYGCPRPVLSAVGVQAPGSPWRPRPAEERVRLLSLPSGAASTRPSKKPSISLDSQDESGPDDLGFEGELRQVEKETRDLCRLPKKKLPGNAPAVVDSKVVRQPKGLRF